MRQRALLLGLLASTLVAAPLAASAQGYGRGASGVIASVNGGDVKLRDGRNIFLKSGTVISPTGQSLQPGERISVQGTPGGNGAINATFISIGGNGNNGNYNNGNYNNGNYNSGNNGNNGNGGRYRRHHHHDGDDGQNGNGQDNGRYNGNGRNGNGQYDNGRYNGDGR